MGVLNKNARLHHKKKKVHKISGKTCIAFLIFMAIMTVISNTISYWMRPEVTIMDSEFKTIIETVWAKGIRRGQKITCENLPIKDQEEWREKEVSVYFQNGEEKIISSENLSEDQQSVSIWLEEPLAGEEECLIKYERRVGDFASTIPATNFYENINMIYSLEPKTDGIREEKIATRRFEIGERKGACLILKGGVESAVIDSSKPIVEGTKIRQAGEITNEGRIELLPKAGDFFYSDFSDWMLEKILPEGSTFFCEKDNQASQEGLNKIRQVILPVPEDVSPDKRRIELERMLGEVYQATGWNVTTEEYRFLECEEWLSVPKETVWFVLKLAMIGLLCLLLYLDMTLYFKSFQAILKSSYLKEALSTHMVSLLLRIFLWSLFIIVIGVLCLSLHSFPMHIISKIFPNDRIFDFNHYKIYYKEWLERRNYYLSIVSEGKGVQYYKELMIAWKNSIIKIPIILTVALFLAIKIKTQAKKLQKPYFFS